MRTVVELVAALLAPCVLILLVGGVLGAPPRPIALVNLAVSVPLTIAAIVLHEIGHALVAKLAHLDVVRIQVGVGRRVWHRRYGSVRVVLNMLPLSGKCFLGASTMYWLRTRVWLAIAAGPLTNLALAWLAVRFPEPLGIADMLSSGVTAMTNFAPRLLFVVINASFALGNLIPMSFKGQAIDTDGKQLLTLPFATAARTDEFLVTRASLTCAELIEAHDVAGARKLVADALIQHPRSFRLRQLQIHLSEHPDMRASRDQLLALAPDAPTTKDARLNDNMVAWYTYWMTDAAFRDEANRLSLRAYQALEKIPFVIATRALMLTWLGRPSQAKSLLGSARIAASTPNERNAVLCATAIAYAACGDELQAEQSLANARALNANARFVALAEQRVRSLLHEHRSASSVPIASQHT